MPIAAATNMLVGRAEAEDETVLRMGFMTKVDSLNPNVGEIDSSYIFWGLLYDAVHVVDEDLNIVGGLCTNWYVDEDYEPYGSAWIMKFTENATWHDGEPFNADDVVFTFNLNCGDSYNTMWANQPYSYWMNYSEKVDEYTVRVHYWDRGTGETMPAAFARMIWMIILPEHLLREMSPSDLVFVWEGVFDDAVRPMIGTGPFMVTDDIYEEYLAGTKLTLVKNPNYFWKEDRGLEVQFDRIEMHFYDDATAMALALETGNLDVAALPPQEYDTIKNKVENDQLQNVVAFDGDKCTFYWTMISICANNGGPNPSRLDPIIRQAMATAMDKQYIIDNYYLGYGVAGTTVIPPVNKEWHYEPTADEMYVYDLEAADELLETGGYRYLTPDAEYRVCTADSWAVQNNIVEEGKPLEYQMGVRQECPEEKEVAEYLRSEWAKVGIGLEYVSAEDSHESICSGEW